VVRVQVTFIYRHRRSGENLIGTKRMVMRLRDDLIVRIDEYHDAGLVEAFMRLTQQREAANDVPEPPKVPNVPATAPLLDTEGRK